MAADIARFGEDRNVVYERREGIGGVARCCKLWEAQGIDTMQTVGHIIRLFRDSGANTVIVDDAGVGGGVVDRLREESIPVVAFNFGGKAREPDKFANAGTEAWYNLRTMMEKGRLALAHDPVVMGQLSSRKYRLQSDARLISESKDDMKKRGLKSPDHADALAMVCSMTGSFAISFV